MQGFIKGRQSWSLDIDSEICDLVSVKVQIQMSYLKNFVSENAWISNLIMTRIRVKLRVCPIQLAYDIFYITAQAECMKSVWSDFRFGRD